MENEIELLDEWIIYSNNNLKKVIRWIKGNYPTIGTLSMGFTGCETIVEKTVVIPTHSFNVVSH